MQFIEQLTMIHKAAIGGAVALIMILLLISARRKRAAAEAPVEVAEAKEPKKRKRDTPKEASLPRRKRRKLAAEAAHSMGVEPSMPIVPAVPEVADVPVITIPEVTIAAEPVAAASVAEYDDAPVETEMTVDMAVVSPHVADDPYLHDGDLDENGVVVAQPGWPSPGELASSFDPDAFDPLPEAQYHDEQYADTSATTALELPTLSTANEAVALEEIEEWADTYDVDEDWAQPAPTVAEDTWTVPEDEPTISVTAIGGNDDAVWSEPDEEPLWEMPEPATEPAVEVEPVNEAPAVAVMEDDTAYEVTESAWADDSEESWQTDVPYEPDVADEALQPIEIPAEAYDVAVAYGVEDSVVEAPPADPMPAYSYEAPNPAVMSNWSQALGGPNSPVVLDLAGLAASGHALELVIEPSADGNGVRLRFGAPGTQDVVEVPVSVESVPDEVAFAEVVTSDESVTPPLEVDNLAFLAGDAPQIEPHTVLTAVVPDATVPPAPIVVDEEPSSVVEASPVVAEVAGPVESPVAVVTYDDVPAYEHVYPPVEDAFEQVADAREPDDDPAQILADIRARLAALDARR